MSALLIHTWTDEIDGRTFSVCETDYLTPCQREILNLHRRHDALADALVDVLEDRCGEPLEDIAKWAMRDPAKGEATSRRLTARAAILALRAAGRLP